MLNIGSEKDDEMISWTCLTCKNEKKFDKQLGTVNFALGLVNEL